MVQLAETNSGISFNTYTLNNQPVITIVDLLSFVSHVE